MKKFARLLSMVLAVATVLSLCIGAFDYVDADKITKGKEEAIEAVYNWGIMQGVSDDESNPEFNPLGKLTRAEMAKILYALEKSGLNVEDWYGDLLNLAIVDAAEVPGWSKGYMGYAFINNTIKGNEKNEINAKGELSYVEATIMLLRAMGVQYDNKEVDGKNVAVDRYTGENWKINALVDGANYGLFKDLDLSNFSAVITREDVAVMIYNTVNYVKENKLGVQFVLASEDGGVVTGVYKDDDNNDYLMLNAEKTSYKVGDLKVEDLMGKRISFWAEKGQQPNTEIVDESKEVIETTIGAIGTTTDGKKYTVDGKEFVEIGEGTEYYLFLNNTMFGTKEESLNLKYEKENNGFQNVTLINNGTSVSVIYNPVKFVIGAEIDVKPEVVNRKYTGKYYVKYGDEKYYISQTEFDKDVWYALSINGDQIVNNGVVTSIALADVKVKGGKILYKNEELKLYKTSMLSKANGEKVDNATLNGIEKRLEATDGEDCYKVWKLLVYNNTVFGWEKVEDTDNDKTSYAYILDKEKISEAGKKATYTITALINDEITTIEGYTKDVDVNAFYNYKVNTDADKTVVTLEQADIHFNDCSKDTNTEDYKNKTVVVYDENLETVVPADKLTIKGNVATYGGIQYVADAFKMVDFNNGYVLFVFKT